MTPATIILQKGPTTIPTMAPVLRPPLPLEGEFVAEVVAEDEGEPVAFTLEPVFFAPVLAAVGAVDPPPFAGVVAALFIAPSQYAVYALIALAISSVFP